MSETRAFAPWAAALGAAFFAIVASAATAQPTAPPGMICVIDDGSGWCWAIPRGAPGQTCTCRTPRGAFTGTIR